MKKFVFLIRKKLHKGSGFSLVEMLFTILILMLSTTIIIQCFGLGTGNFVRETRASEAQLLCSSLTASIQNELTFAQDIELEGTNLKSYFSNSRRMGESCSIVVNNGEIMIQKPDPDNPSGDPLTYPLVASANYASDNRAGVSSGGEFLRAGMETITWDTSKKQFTVKIWVDDAKNVHDSFDAAKAGALAFSEFSVRPVGTVK